MKKVYRTSRGVLSYLAQKIMHWTVNSDGYLNPQQLDTLT